MVTKTNATTQKLTLDYLNKIYLCKWLAFITVLFFSGYLAGKIIGLLAILAACYQMGRLISRLKK